MGGGESRGDSLQKPWCRSALPECRQTCRKPGTGDQSCASPEPRCVDSNGGGPPRCTNWTVWLWTDTHESRSGASCVRAYPQAAPDVWPDPCSVPVLVSSRRIAGLVCALAAHGGSMTTSKKSSHAPSPVDRPSDEADEHQLALARQEGAAYAQSLRYMAEEVADTGGQQRAGDHLVGFAQERAEGMWQLHQGKLQWHEPGPKENCHLEVAVCDGSDGRFVPYLEIKATLVAADDRQVGPFNVPFVWHPGLYHYGRNVEVPGGGTYTLRVRIAPPTFMRHDQVNGRRYAEPIDVEFRDVRITPGRE